MKGFLKQMDDSEFDDIELDPIALTAKLVVPLRQRRLA